MTTLNHITKGSIAAIAVACLVLASAAQAQIVTTGLIQDLDADVGVTGTSPVTAWANQAASGGDDVATALGTVTLLSSAVNGHDALAFSGSASLIGDDAAAFDSLANGSGFTWFAVIDADYPVGSPNSIFSTLTDEEPYSGIEAGLLSSGNAMIRVRGPLISENYLVTGAPYLPTLGYNILVGRMAAGTGSQLGEIFSNSGAESVASNSNTIIDGSTGSGILNIGIERLEGTEFFEGDLARLLIYSGPLSDAELNATGVALGSTYNIAWTVPEPSTLVLSVLAVAGLGLCQSRRRRRR